MGDAWRRFLNVPTPDFEPRHPPDAPQVSSSALISRTGNIHWAQLSASIAVGRLHFLSMAKWTGVTVQPNPLEGAKEGEFQAFLTLNPNSSQNVSLWIKSMQDHTNSSDMF